MSQFCGCLSSSKQETPTQVPIHPEAGFMPRTTSLQTQPPQYDAVDVGYAPVVPLPRYTPRPVSIHEKTLENNFQHNSHTHQPDEKNRQEFESTENALQSQSTGSSSVTVTATMDDASSAYSFPSSFGHTSTETRDTPPPPYSSCGSSSLYSRSRASSVRSHRRSGSFYNYPLPTNQTITTTTTTTTTASSDFVSPVIAPPPMAHVQSHMIHHPPTAYIPSHFRQSNSQTIPSQRRYSWESR